MRLADKSGQDVEKLSNKIARMAPRISGTGSAPINMFSLVATAFIDCKFLAFQIKSELLHDLVEIYPNALSADEII